jgi:hypothetical protein
VTFSEKFREQIRGNTQIMQAAYQQVGGHEDRAAHALERWLGDYDLLVLRRDHTDPLVLLPWRTWAVLLKRVRP